MPKSRLLWYVGTSEHMVSGPVLLAEMHLPLLVIKLEDHHEHRCTQGGQVSMASLTTGGQAAVQGVRQATPSCHSVSSKVHGDLLENTKDASEKTFSLVGV